MKRVKSVAKKTGVSIVGFSVIIIGIILLPLPGPGMLIIVAGIAILATEFEYAEKLLVRIRRRFASATNKTKSLFKNKK